MANPCSLFELINPLIKRGTEQVPTIVRNKQGFGYMYADLSSIMDHLEEHHVHIQQTIQPSTITRTNHETGEIIETIAPTTIAPGVLLMGQVLTRLKTDKDPEWTEWLAPCAIIISQPGKNNNWQQAYGSAETYARRYSLITAAGIATADDDDAHASGQAWGTTAPLTPIVRPVSRPLS